MVANTLNKAQATVCSQSVRYNLKMSRDQCKNSSLMEFTGSNLMLNTSTQTITK